MTQLIVENTPLPPVKLGRYSCRTETLSETVTMISGRMVEEIIGEVYVIDYAAESMHMEVYQELVRALRKGGGIYVQFLPDDGTELRSGYFLCTKRPAPSFQMEHLGEPIWNDVSFSLREVSPHA